MNRRQFLKSSVASAAGAAALGWSRSARAAGPSTHSALGTQPSDLTKGTADSVIFIWLPGGIAQTDTWDPKKHTPYVKGMKGSQILGTCSSIPTAADGIQFGAGLETIASQMDKGAVLRTLTNQTKFGAVHLKAQYYLMTGYLFPAGVKAPSIGAVVARSLGRKHPLVPAYIDIGRDINTSNQEFLFINEYSGPGFYGPRYAPFMIPEPAQGLVTLETASGMKRDRLDRRQKYLSDVNAAGPVELHDAEKAAEYIKTMEEARAMMDSPVKKAFDFTKDEKPETLKAYDVGHRFGHGCLLARRLVEQGARFVQVEYQYAPFGGFDTHENGRDRMVNMKKQIDRPIGTLIKDLQQRGMLDKTLVVVATEFGRTIANQPAAGGEPDGFAETATGETLTIENEKMYGFHGHFSSVSNMLFFGGGFKKGYAHGKTSPQHPMLAIENPVTLSDAHATIYKALGIPANHNYVTEGRPFYVTNNGKGKAIDALLA